MISVVIPCRAGDVPVATLTSLDRQTHLPNVVIVVPDHGRGAAWARNRGFEATDSEYVLFSDADIDWMPDALENLLACLQAHPDAAYSFGAYHMAGRDYCQRPYDAELLKKINLASTMSLFRREWFPGFDENLVRFQDWDLNLTLAEQGHHGVNCGRRIFTTEKRNGITFGSITSQEAEDTIRKKHGI